jgi:bleomycin hydrolase
MDEGSLSHDVMRILKKYGAMPESVYSGLTADASRHNHGRLKRDLKKYLDDLIGSRKISEDWIKGFNQILDTHLGVIQADFSFEGKTYTPKSFVQAHLVIDPDDYLTLTSFSHHEPYTQFVLEIPDNYSRSSYFNLPLEELTEICRNSLLKGQTVVWDCDVSEKGFSARQGLAIVPKEADIQTTKSTVFDQPSPEMQVTAEMRQKEFDTYELTDDHLMHIVGLAKDQNGSYYYYVKNSWGQGVGINGYLFASEPYVKLNTIAIMVHREAVPEKIRSKLDLKEPVSQLK